MRAALAAALLLSGCVLPFCGPTIYRLTGITASTYVTEPWDAQRAEAGAREAGYNATRADEFGLYAEATERTLGADASNSTRVWVSLRTAGVEGERDEVDRAADALIAQHDAAVRAAMGSFAHGAAWTLAAPIEWDKGMLHGDC